MPDMSGREDGARTAVPEDAARAAGMAPDGAGTRGAPDAEECYGPAPAATPTPTDPAPPAGPPYADCVLCGEPTEHPSARPGIVLCPVCEWQEAQRTACSG
ncbi:hypothetical protein [Streptomyces sp. NPDC003077]|uniref:hypothetical protein n=1 Tax=Streptomyces sp. NPDC003077 TaxID=3154443 RepID=UPI0033AA271B